MRRALRYVMCLVGALLLTAPSSWAQRTARADYDFGTYLLGRGLMRDAITLVGNLDNNYTPAALDTMHYLRGWTHYHNQQFGPAAEAFSQVGVTSSFYPKSVFYGTVCNLEVGDVDGALGRLDEFCTTPQAKPYGELVALQREGIALLEGNTTLYHQLRKSHTLTDNILLTEQQRLDELVAARHRSPKPWVAGVASAVVPGLGQIYAGNVGEGVASFFMVGAFVALTAHSWHKAGTAANWRTIAYGSVASLLYVGNIFGSIASVRIYYQNFEELNRQAVMYSIHIPLRAIFD